MPFILGMRFAAKIMNRFHVLWYNVVVLHRAPSQYFTGLGWIHTDSRHFTFRKMKMYNKTSKNTNKKKQLVSCGIKGLVLACLLSWHQDQLARYKNVVQPVLMQPLFLSCPGSNVSFPSIRLASIGAHTATGSVSQKVFVDSRAAGCFSPLVCAAIGTQCVCLSLSI